MLEFLQHRDFAILTIAVSLPAFFVFFLQNPPSFTVGMPYLLLYMWSVFSVPAVPAFLLLEIIAVQLIRRSEAGQNRFIRWHLSAMAISGVAILIYFTPLGDLIAGALSGKST